MKTLFAPVLLLLFIATSCVSTRNTIKNIDDNAPDLVLLSNNVFENKVFAKDKKYGYNKDYPVNLFYQDTKNENINQPRFLDALAGPNGEKVSYRKLESCCPFPSKRAASGAGLLDVFEISWDGNLKPLTIYLNIYEKGILMVPMGLTLKK